MMTRVAYLFGWSVIVGLALLCPREVIAFDKPLNNGTASCENFCLNRGGKWGPMGTCIGVRVAEGPKAGQSLSCGDVAGSGHHVICQCAELPASVISKPGNNGTATCENFCANRGGDWGRVASCIAGLPLTGPREGQTIACAETYGAGNNVTCLCGSPPPSALLQIGLSGLDSVLADERFRDYRGIPAQINLDNALAGIAPGTLRIPLTDRVVTHRLVVSAVNSFAFSLTTSKDGIHVADEAQAGCKPVGVQHTLTRDGGRYRLALALTITGTWDCNQSPATDSETPVKVRVNLESNPAGARVFLRERSGRLLTLDGRTPLAPELTLYGREPVAVVFKKDGYVECVQSVSPDKQQALCLLQTDHD